nr:hypothetical protein [Tanacetum cinerariifolium]
LVQVFLDEVHTKNPVLDPILLQLHVTSVKENGIGWDPGSCLVCQFLSGVYSMYNMQPWVAWKMFHSASVSCYGYLIREQIQDNCELESGAGSRDLADSSGQRLYWSCMKSESLEYPYPLPNPPSRLGDSSNAFLTAYSPQIDTNLEGQSWYYYLTEISLRKLELEINDYFLRQSQEHTQQPPQRLGLLRSINNAVMGFDKRLFAYWQNIPPSLSFSLEDIRPCKTELEQYLRMKMMWIRHDLCRISLYMILHHDLSQSAQLHTSFTNMAKKGLSIALQFMNISVNSHRNHGTWFGFRLGV